MVHLLSILDSEVKKAVKTIGTSGICYTTALKTLKRDFRSPLLMLHLHQKNLFDKLKSEPMTGSPYDGFTKN